MGIRRMSCRRPLAAGSDPTGHGGLVAGFSNHRAIELLVEAGFTVPEAIGIATLNGARAR